MTEKWDSKKQTRQQGVGQELSVEVSLTILSCRRYLLWHLGCRHRCEGDRKSID